MSDFHDDSNAHEPHFDESSSSWSEPARSTSEPTAKRARFDIAALVPWLPRLGATLWLERKSRRAYAPATIGARGLLLLDHP